MIRAWSCVTLCILLQLGILGIRGLCMAFADSVTLFWILAAFYTIGEVLNGPMQGIILTENVERNVRGTVVGLDGAMDQTLNVLAPLVAGSLMTVIGLQLTFAVFMSLFFVSLLGALLVYPRVQAQCTADSK